MKNGNCPKCESADIAIFKKSPGISARHGNMLFEHIPLGLMKSAKIQHYICRKCGFLEHYIKDEDIKKL